VHGAAGSAQIGGKTDAEAVILGLFANGGHCDGVGVTPFTTPALAATAAAASAPVFTLGARAFVGAWHGFTRAFGKVDAVGATRRTAPHDATRS